MTAPALARPRLTPAFAGRAARTGCPTFMGSRVIRVTRLNSCGKPFYSCDPNIPSMATTSGVVNITLEPEVEEGESLDTRNLNGDLCVQGTTPDTLSGINVAIEFCQIDPVIMQIINPTWKIVRNAWGVITGFRMGGNISDEYGFALELWPKVMGNTGDACLTPEDLGEQSDPNDPWNQNGYFLLPWVIAKAPDEMEITGDEVTTFTCNGRTKGGSQWDIGPYLVTRDQAGNPSPLLDPIEDGSGKAGFTYPQDPTRIITDPDHFHRDLVYVSPPAAQCGGDILCRPEATLSFAGDALTVTIDPGNLDTIAPADENGKRPAVWVSWGDGEPREDIANAPGGALTHTYPTGGDHMVRMVAPNGAFREWVVNSKATMRLAAPDSMPVGTTSQLKAEYVREDGTTLDVTRYAEWSSDKPEFVRMDRNIRGLAHGLKEGTATVSVTYAGKETTHSITVAGRIENLTIEGADSVFVQGTTDLKAKAKRSGATELEDVTAKGRWWTSNTQYATVNNGTNKGRVTGVKATTPESGQVTVYIEVEGVRGTHSVSVKARQVGQLVLEGPGGTTPPAKLTVGAEATQLTARFTPQGGQAQDVTAECEWSSAEPTKVEVSNTGATKGQVKGLANTTEGEKVRVTATYEGDKHGTADFEVEGGAPPSTSGQRATSLGTEPEHPHTVTLSLDNPPAGEVQIDWGDGEFERGQGAGPYRHTYEQDGTYPVVVTDVGTGNEVTREQFTAGNTAPKKSSRRKS